MLRHQCRLLQFLYRKINFSHFLKKYYFITCFPNNFVGAATAPPAPAPTVWVKKSPWGFLTFSPKQLGIFGPNFTCLLYVLIYARLQIFTQLSATLTTLCHIFATTQMTDRQTHRQSDAGRQTSAQVESRSMRLIKYLSCWTSVCRVKICSRASRGWSIIVASLL